MLIYTITNYQFTDPNDECFLSPAWTSLIFLSCQSQERDWGIIGGDEGISKSP